MSSATVFDTRCSPFIVIPASGVQQPSCRALFTKQGSALRGYEWCEISLRHYLLPHGCLVDSMEGPPCTQWALIMGNERLYVLGHTPKGRGLKALKGQMNTPLKSLGIQVIFFRRSRSEHETFFLHEEGLVERWLGSTPRGR